MKKQEFQREENGDMQHVIKVYDRSNKHVYKQIIKPHYDGSQSKQSMMDDGEEEVKYVMMAK